MILEELEKREKIKGLTLFAKHVTEKACNHLKRIIIQMPQYDLHDESHANAVLKNLEDILGKTGIEKLSFFELALLYLAAYMHDTGMALPDWEIKLLEAVEIGGEDWRNDFYNNLSAPLSLSKSKKLISEHAKSIYKSFNDARKWDFSFDSEEELQKNLASLVKDYQNFRNGYSEEFRELKEDELVEKNKNIRVEFIRKTHADRSAQYSENLGGKLKSLVDNNWGLLFAKNLGEICSSHCKDFKYLTSLKTSALYIGDETANLQFVASLLRIADVMHFSIDRAPSILSSEMEFNDPLSFCHWAIKQQGVTYTVKVISSNQKQISFKAYCREPEYYYDLLNYVKWIDTELSYFFQLSKKWDRDHDNTTSERWRIPLYDEVDCNGICPDESVFTPVPDLSFTLDQKRIIELLMGVGLYKDKFACLRELYQNSLDACRCMIATRNGTVKGQVEFGLEREGGYTYLYCLDNGIGMTKDIIENYLVRIGNSYYNSHDFSRKLASWGKTFTPVSQFGIGILSCFMLGDQIDITTKPAPEISQDSIPIRCAINGPHEHFYYQPYDEIDLEKIGKQGTLLRFRLKESGVIDDKPLKDIWLAYAMNRISENYSGYKEEIHNSLKINIHKILTDFISLPQKDIEVLVKFNDDTKEKIVRYDQLFDCNKFDMAPEELDNLKTSWQNRFSNFDIQIQNKNIIKPYCCHVSQNGIDFSWILSFPTSEYPIDRKLTAKCRFPAFGNNGVFIDGISVKNTGKISVDGIDQCLIRNGQLNFLGSVRPQLSVDRLNFVSWPSSLQNELENILDLVIKETVRHVQNHVKNEKFRKNDPRINMIWDHLLTMFWICKPQLLNVLVSNVEFQTVELPEIANFLNNKFNVTTHRNIASCC